MFLLNDRVCCLLTRNKVILNNSFRSLMQQPGTPNELVIGGTGNPYATTVRRRREVKDLSFPDFKNQECLKWSKWSMLRDVKRRIKNAEYWQYRMNLQNISASRSLPNIVKEMAKEERLQTPKDSSITHSRNRCALTSRGRGVHTTYRLSRIVWRELADCGQLSGVIRAKWG